MTEANSPSRKGPEEYWVQIDSARDLKETKATVERRWGNAARGSSWVRRRWAASGAREVPIARCSQPSVSETEDRDSAASISRILEESCWMSASQEKGVAGGAKESRRTTARHRRCRWKESNGAPPRERVSNS